MKEELHQGDILKIEHIKKPVLVVSKDFFNQTYLADRFFDAILTPNMTSQPITRRSKAL